MSRKVLVISSSPRRGGNSDTLCDEFVRGAKEAGNDVEKLFLKDYTIHYCTGCGLCSIQKKPCPLQDDMAGLLEKLLAADVIVMATPLYFYAMCGQMKTFIDRICARYLEVTNKEFYFILTAADTGEKIAQRAVEEFRDLLDCLPGSVEKGVIYGLGVWNVGEIKTHPAMQEAYKAGKGC